MKKLILLFAIVLGGIISSCGNQSTTNKENDTIVVEEVTDSCICDTVCIDTCTVCNPVE